jgi:hypothetical protein
VLNSLIRRGELLGRYFEMTASSVLETPMPILTTIQPKQRRPAYGCGINDFRVATDPMWFRGVYHRAGSTAPPILPTHKLAKARQCPFCASRVWQSVKSSVRTV